MAMAYSKDFLKVYKKYDYILKTANLSFNKSNINQAICHSDMDPKNVMWNNDSPVVID